MRIWHKILVAPTVAIVFLLSVGAISWYIVNRQGLALEDLATNRMTAATRALDASRDLSQAHSDIYRLFTWVGNLKEAEIHKADLALATKIANVASTLVDLQKAQGATEAERKNIDAVLPRIASYGKVVHDAVDLAVVDVTTAAMAMQAADKEYEGVLAQLDALVQIEQGVVRQSYQTAAAEEKTARFILLALVLVAVAASVLISAAMSAAIVRPLNVAIAAARRIAGGDLSMQLQASGADEAADLLRTLSEMVRGLRDLVGQVAGAAHMVADTSEQIAQGNLDLSQRTEQQASTLEETASSMEQLTSTVALNAQSARKASELAVAASETARKGGDSVAEVVSTMDGISEASRRIAEIIGVIDGIAFQTNILALNAAVEAARAGEQGRGFAVVAAEVRNLAQRSAAAAKEIKDLIGDSVQKVGAGTQLVGTAGQTMQEIVASARSVKDLIADIARASGEQHAGIQQVNGAVTQMDHAVQQNASLVEEASAATESMKAQAASLLQLVARFQLDVGRPPHAASGMLVHDQVGTPLQAHWQFPALATGMQ